MTTGLLAQEVQGPAPAASRPERVVLKIGTSSVISGEQPDPARIGVIADAVLALRRSGTQAVIIASGAIAVGSARIRAAGAAPAAPGRQMAAAVGQAVLFEAFREALARRGLLAAQILLTPPDLTSPEHRDSARAVLEGSLQAGVVPVVNENDAVMVRNNDVLAALLAAAIGAGWLVLLTDVSGLCRGDPGSGAGRIPEVAAMTPEIEQLARLPGDGAGTGGMQTKLCAAWIASMAGVATVIARAGSAETVVGAVRGADVGTVIRARRPVRAPDLGRLWRALSALPSGRVRCAPAVVPVLAARRPVSTRHVVDASGSFAAGGVVDIVADGGRVVARGRSRVASGALAAGPPRTLIRPEDYVTFLEERECPTP